MFHDPDRSARRKAMEDEAPRSEQWPATVEMLRGSPAQHWRYAAVMISERLACPEGSLRGRFGRLDLLLDLQEFCPVVAGQKGGDRALFA